MLSCGHKATKVISLSIGTALALVAAIGCSSDTEGAKPTPDAGTAASGSIKLAGPPYRTTVAGKLKETDAARAKSAHDAYARAIQSTVPEHLAFFGKTSVATGATEAAEVILIDAWDDKAQMERFYTDPTTATALGELFAGAPLIESWQHPADWAEWGVGSHAAATTKPVSLIRTRTVLKPIPLEESRATHNRTAGGASQAKAQSLSDIAHMAHVGLNDTTQMFFFDLWQDLDKAGQFFSDPSTKAGGAEIFGGPPDVAIYSSTDWKQWDKTGPKPGPIDGVWTVTELTCNGAKQPIGAFTLEVDNASGSFIQEFGPTCRVDLTESYEYPNASTFVINAKSVACNPNAGCGAIFGGATCPPLPPKTDFSYAVSGATMTFRRTAAAPSDPCPVGAEVVFTMTKKS